MFTLKQRTEQLLASVHVTAEFIDQPACDVWFALKNTYAPDVLVQMYWPEQYLNPLVTSRFPGIPLRTALEDVARYCGVEMTITDHGAIALRVPRRVEAMRHAVEIEVDPHRWVKLEPKYVD